MKTDATLRLCVSAGENAFLFWKPALKDLSPLQLRLENAGRVSRRSAEARRNED